MQALTPREPFYFGDCRRNIVFLKISESRRHTTRCSQSPRNRSKRAARRPSSIRSRRCGQAQESLAMPADAKAAPACPNPGPASSSKAGPPCPRPEARNPSGGTCSRPTRRRPHFRLTSQAHHRPHRNRRRQLNAVPPVLGRAASSASDPGPDIMPKIIPHSLRARRARIARPRMQIAQSDTEHRLRQTRKRLSKPGRPGVRPPPSPWPVQAGAAGGREGGTPLVLSPVKPPPRAEAGIRRSRSEPAPHAAASRSAVRMVMRLSTFRQRPWPLFCLFAGRPTSAEGHCASSSGGQPPGACALQDAWRPVCVTARAGVPASSRLQTGEVSVSASRAHTERPQEAL